MRQITNKDDKQKLIETLETMMKYLNQSDYVCEVDIENMLKIVDKYEKNA